MFEQVSYSTTWKALNNLTARVEMVNDESFLKIVDYFRRITSQNIGTQYVIERRDDGSDYRKVLYLGWSAEAVDGSFPVIVNDACHKIKQIWRNDYGS